MQYLPLAMLPDDVAMWTTILLAAILMWLTVRWWLGAGGLGRSGGGLQLALLGNIAVFNLVRIDQVNSAVGPAAITAAIASQRRCRWVLCGAALGIGLCRLSNGLPLLVAIMVAQRNRPTSLVRIVAGVALVLGPLGVLAFAWDPSWIAHFLEGQAAFPRQGVIASMGAVLGASGPGLTLALVCAVGALIAWTAADGLSIDGAAAVLALTLLSTHVGGPYVVVFLIPGAACLARRRSLTWLALGAIAIEGVVALAANLLGTDHPGVLLAAVYSPAALAVILVLPLIGTPQATPKPPLIAA